MAGNYSLKQQLMIAAEQGDFEGSKRIINLLSRYKPWYPGHDFLCAALAHKHLDIARLFLNQGCAVFGDRREYGNFSALHLAVMHGDSMIVETILRRGASDSINTDGMIPLHLVVYRNFDESCLSFPSRVFDEESSIIIDTLIQHGSDINTRVLSDFRHGFTALHLAVECGNENIIPILLSRNADLNARASNGLTPLHIAAIHGRSRTVQIFLDRGVKAFIKDIRYKTPIRWAIERRHVEIVEMLINYEQLSPRRSHFPRLADDRYVLLSAICLDNVSIVRSLLDMGVSIHSTWGNRETALHVAVKQGIEEIIKLLLLHGANLQAVSREGKTPLFLAVESGAVEIVKILLDGDDSSVSGVFLIGPSKCTPLHVAVMSDNEEMVRLLLLRGAHVYRQLLANNSQEISSEYLFHVAVKNGSLPICKLLLDYGADIDSKDVRGRNALYFAAERGNVEMVRELCDISLKQKPEDKDWAEGYPALYIAAYHGDEAIVHLLLEKGLDVKVNIKGYSTPLHAATERNHEKIVELLLEYGADVNETKSDAWNGRTALHCAIENGFFSIADLLIRKGADVDAKILGNTKAGYTPLHCAVEKGDLKMVKLLLDKKADVHLKSEANQTPLFLAIKKSQEGIVQCLVDNGADVNVLGNTTRRLSNLCFDEKVACTVIRPLAFAVCCKNENIVKILLEKGALDDVGNETTSALHLAAQFPRGEIVRKLLQFGGDVKSSCSLGNTPLSHAVCGGHVETVKLLIEKGAYLHPVNLKGNGLLHVAMNSKTTSKELIQILLRCGQNVKARNQRQGTPLHCCYPSVSIYAGCDLFEVLLDYGAEVNAQNEVGDTPLHVAISNCDGKSVNILLENGADINAVNHEGKSALKSITAFQNDAEVHPSMTLMDVLMAELIVKVIIVRQAAGLFVSEQNLKLLNREEIETSYREFKKEFDETKKRQVYQNFMYSDILIKNTEKLEVFFRNPALVKNIDSTDFKTTFPIFASRFEHCIHKAKERKLLLESSSKYLESILDFVFPSLIVQHIFSFLSSVDLKNMARVYESPPPFVPRVSG